MFIKCLGIAHVADLADVADVTDIADLLHDAPAASGVAPATPQHDAAPTTPILHQEALSKVDGSMTPPWGHEPSTK